MIEAAPRRSVAILLSVALNVAIPRSVAIPMSAVLMVASPAGASQVRQDGSDPSDPEHKAEAPVRPEDMPLADLPAPPDLRPSAPRPRAIEAIDRLLSEVVDPEPSVRKRATDTLLEAKSDWVSGISRRIDSLADRADRAGMNKLLERARDKSRDRLFKETGAREPSPDYLEAVLHVAEPTSQTWRDLAQLLSLSRMLTAIGSTEAAREIIRIHVRFGEFMRIDCQRQLESLGELSTAALIETLRHPAPAIADWAHAQLKLRGRLNPHDAVSTENPATLADILVALGRTGNPETAQLLISFAGTEQPNVRIAARQAITLLGESSAWQLRDAYLNTTGRRPPRDWTWKRTARELFTEFDRLRLEKVYKIYAEAKKKKQEGDLSGMRTLYDRILTLTPEFESAADMVDGYREYATSVSDSEPQTALLALRRAARIAGSETVRNEVEAQRLLLEATMLRKRGIIDTSLLKRAAALDRSALPRAAELRTPSTSTPVWGEKTRYLVAFAVSLLSLLGAGWVLFSSMRRRPKKSAGPSEDDD